MQPSQLCQRPCLLVDKRLQLDGWGAALPSMFLSLSPFMSCVSITSVCHHALFIPCREERLVSTRGLQKLFPREHLMSGWICLEPFLFGTLLNAAINIAGTPCILFFGFPAQIRAKGILCVFELSSHGNFTGREAQHSCKPVIVFTWVAEFRWGMSL